MPVSEEYLEHVVEKLEYVGQVTAKKLFGGVGIYLDGLFCALIGDDVLYFKVDDTLRSRRHGAFYESAVLPGPSRGI